MSVVDDLSISLLTGRVIAEERPDYTHVGARIDDAVEAERLGFRRVWPSERYDLKNVENGLPAVQQPGAPRLFDDGATISVNGDIAEGDGRRRRCAGCGDAGRVGWMKRPRTKSLDVDQIAAAALELVDREGADALTIRRLAEELGVGAMTLYGYVRTKEEIAEQLTELALRELQIPTTGEWDERLGRLFRNLRELLWRHPWRRLPGRPAAAERTGGVPGGGGRAGHLARRRAEPAGLCGGDEQPGQLHLRLRIVPAGPGLDDGATPGL